MTEFTTPAQPAPYKKKYRNLTQCVIEHITNNIHAGVLKPGEKLPTESEIMALHGVSRTVVREAISHLQAAALVQTRHGVGTFALGPPAANLGIHNEAIITVRDVLAILELRISLETEAAWLAASRRSDGQVAEMAAVLKKMQAGSSQEDGSVNADVQFHLLVAQATGNRYFVEILSHLGTTIIPRARLNTAKLAHDDSATYLGRVNHEHEDIFNAILRKDPEAARAAMRTHLSNSRERLKRAQELIEAQQT